MDFCQFTPGKELGQFFLMAIESDGKILKRFKSLIPLSTAQVLRYSFDLNHINTAQISSEVYVPCIFAHNNLPNLLMFFLVIIPSFPVLSNFFAL